MDSLHSLAGFSPLVLKFFILLTATLLLCPAILISGSLKAKTLGDRKESEKTEIIVAGREGVPSRRVGGGSR